MANILTLVIPAKHKNDLQLGELLQSIEAQVFPREQLEVLVITEGTSESAKAIGIRRAKGHIIGFLASDNVLIGFNFLSNVLEWFKFKSVNAIYPCYYHYTRRDKALNRYFALIGGNDPLSYYMGKNDRADHIDGKYNVQGTIGDNGFFIRKECIERTDLDNYYHIDNAIESGVTPYAFISHSIWHKTGDSLFKFLLKRYRYGLQHAFNKNRRWHLVDFKKRGDVLRLIFFILASVTFIHPLVTAIRGYTKIRDHAWFIHPVMCFLTVVTYAFLVSHLCLRRMFQSSSARSEGRLA